MFFLPQIGLMIMIFYDFPKGVTPKKGIIKIIIISPICG